MDSVHNAPEGSQGRFLSVEKQGKLPNGQNLTVLLKENSKIDQKIQVLSQKIARQQTQPEFKVQLKINQWELQFLKGKQQRLAIAISKIARKTDIQPENIDAVLTDLEGPKNEPPIMIRPENLENVYRDIDEWTPRNRAEQGLVKDKGKEKEEAFVPIDPRQRQLQEKVNLNKTQKRKLADLSTKAANTEIKDAIGTLHDLLTHSKVYDDDLALKFNSEIKKFDREEGLKPLLGPDINNQNRKQLLSFVGTLRDMASQYETLKARKASTKPNHELSGQLDNLHLQLMQDFKQNLDKVGEEPLKEVLAPSPDSQRLSKVEGNLNEFKKNIERYHDDLKFLTDFFKGAKPRLGKRDKKYLRNAEKILMPQMKEIENLLERIKDGEPIDDTGGQLANHLNLINSKTINDYFDKQEKIMQWYHSQFQNQKKRFQVLATKYAKKNTENLIRHYVQTHKEEAINNYNKNKKEVLEIDDDVLVKDILENESVDRIVKTIFNAADAVSTWQRNWNTHFGNLQSRSDQMAEDAGKRVNNLFMLAELRNILVDKKLNV